MAKKPTIADRLEWTIKHDTVWLEAHSRGGDLRDDIRKMIRLYRSAIRASKNRRGK